MVTCLHSNFYTLLEIVRSCRCSFKHSIVFYFSNKIFQFSCRVYSKQTKKNFWFELKQDLIWLCFSLFRETKNKKKSNSVCFSVSNLYRNNWYKQNCFETTLNFLKNNKICSLSNFFGWSSVCFGSIDTLGIEAKQPKQTVSNQTKTNRKNPKFSEKYQNILSIKLFRLLFCLFRFNRNTETLCFGKEPKQTVCFG